MINLFHSLTAAWTRILKNTGLPRSPLFHRVEDIRKYGAKVLPLDQNRTEVRMYAWVMTAMCLLLTLEPMFYISLVDESLTYKIATLAPSRWAIVSAFFVSFVLTVPHMWTLTFRSDLLDKEILRAMAGAGAWFSGLIWVYLATLAHPLDVSWVECAFAIRAVVCICFANIFGYSVNAQQLREEMKRASIHSPIS